MASRDDDGTRGAPGGEEAGDPCPSRSGGDALPPGRWRRLPLHDADRLGVLLTSLEPRLRAVALRITRHPESARDVVQSTFEKILRHGERFQGQSLVSTWVHRIVTNEALMWLRAQRRRAELYGETDDAPLAGLADAAPGPAERLQRRERLRRLHDGLEDLSEEERDVMLCCALADETYAEYGGRTGVHPSAVKSRAYRARRRLGALLREAAH
jgi:RNA polymerase sigma-70 factor (ECF subfamily)